MWPSQCHKHIIALETTPSKAAFYEISAVIGKYLIKSFCPSQALIPRLLKADGLFIIENCLFAVADDFTVNNVINREFNIFSQEMMLPTMISS